MKKLLVTLIALGFAGMASAQISVDSSYAPHNFNDGVCGNYATVEFNDHTPCVAEAGTGGDGSGWNDSGERCKVCHVPHEKLAGMFDEAQLWNHAVAADPAVYTMYNEEPGAGTDGTGPFGTIDAPEVTEPTGTSLLCLGCHDGVTNLSNFGGHTATTDNVATAPYTGTFSKVNLTQTLDTTHPVSIEYTSDSGAFNDGRHDTDLQEEGVDPLGVGFNNLDLLEADTGGGTGLFVQCTSCHDPHKGRVGETVEYLLVESNDDSALCIACHNK